MINVFKIFLERVDEYASTLFLKHHFISVKLKNLLFLCQKFTINNCYIALISVPKKHIKLKPF